MVPLYVITKQGFGRILRFDSGKPAEAYAHHEVEQGDAFMCSPTEMFRCYGFLEIYRLMQMLGAEQMKMDFKKADPGHTVGPTLRKKAIEDFLPRIFALVVEQSVVPGKSTRTKETVMAAKAEKTKAKAAKKAAAPVKKSRLDESAIIKMKKDGEGKAYGKGNNPKRAGSDSAKRFDSYKDGMTVGAALKAGLTAADLAWDAKKGYISIA